MSFVHARRGAVLLLIPVLALTLSFPPSADVQAEEILAQAAPKAESVEFAGMKPIPAGEFKMGLDVKDLVKLYGDPKKKPSRKHHKLLMEEHKMDWWEMLLLETPEHEVETVAYALDVFTVTNAQYRRFLDESQKASFFTRKKVNTLSLVAKEIFGERDFDAWYAESIFWLNEAKLLQRWEEIRKTNEPRIEAILKEFNAFLPAAAKKKDFLELPDKQRAEGWVMFVLPDGIALTVYRRPIPDHWLKAAPDDDDEKKDPKKHVPRELLPKKMESWPVVWVTAEDADAFAEWAGKHVPTEAEYEKAARGPDAWLYPWGKTWNWMEERNRLVWRKAEPEPKGPASQYLNLPVDVTRCADSASPYGMMHMLGNVREWTSSVPVLYPDSTAKKQDWHGSDGCRVLRSTSYGDGQLSGDGEKKPYLELMHRNTARALESTPGAGIGVTARFLAVGFRCAKYPVASRDVLLLRQKAMVASGARRSAAKYDAIRAYGVEKNDYDASGGGNHTYVKSHTTVLGVVPIDRSSFAQAQELIAASKETDPAKGGPQLFAWIYWNGDLKVEIVKEKVVQPEAPADEGAPEGEAEKPDDAGETGEKTDKKDAPKKDAKKDKKDRKKDRKKQGGRKAPEEEETGEPAGPQIITTREFLAGDPEHAYYLGIVDGRLAIFEGKARGPELIGYLPVQTAAGQAADAPPLLKAKEKTLSDLGSASIDAGKGLVRLRLTTKTRSQTSPDVFVFDVILKVEGSLAGTWRGHTSK